MLSKELINGGWKLFYHNGIYMGDVLIDDDGFYKWWANKDLVGYQTEESLMEIANHLTEANADWNRELDKYFHEENNFSGNSSNPPQDVV